MNTHTRITNTRPTSRVARWVWVASLLVAAPAWATIDQGEVCGTCHDDIAERMEAPVPHAPVAMGECSSCHNPHVSRFEKLLLDRPGPMCASCHEDLAGVADRPFVHEPVASGECTACHEAHGGSHEGLLVESGDTLCSSCHTEVDAWSARPYQHAPFGTGACSDCHDPHASDHRGLTVASTGEMCSTCHEPDTAFRTAHDGYPVERADCQQCHDPHASEREGLFRETLHAPFDGGACTTCHALPGSDDPFRPKVSIDRLCGDCHEDQRTTSTTAAFPHIGGAGTDCVSCHNPHTANGSGLLKTDQQDLCTSCHDPAGASSGGEGVFVSHAELECSTCHAPHGSDEPLLFVEDSTAICSGCHSHQHSVAHPQGEDVFDPRNEHPMDCLSCHGIHDAPYEKYMHRDPQRDLCVGCHKNRGGGR